MGKSSGWSRALPWVLGAAAALAGVVFALLWRPGAIIPIERAFPIDADHLLVHGTSGDDTQTNRWSSLGVLGTDGVIRSITLEEGPLTLLGVTDEVVWLDHRERSIHARRLPSLQLVPGLSEAVANHGALSHGHEMAGFDHDRIFLSGADRKEYALTLDGTIEPAGEYQARYRGVTIRDVPRPDPPPDGETMRRMRTLLKDHPELTKATMVGPGPGAAPLWLSDPPGFLARSFDYHKGGQTQSLHRLTEDGTVVWSISVEAMMDALELEGQLITIVWVGYLGGTLAAVVQLSESDVGESSDDRTSSHTQRLVDIDVAAGAVSNARMITREEA